VHDPFRCLGCGASSASATRCERCGGGSFSLARPPARTEVAEQPLAELVSLQAARRQRDRRQAPVKND